MAHSSILRRPAVMLLLALVSVSLVVTMMGKLAGGPSSLEQKRVQLTGAAGSESYPAFSPDSKRVAYSAREGAKTSPFHIFVRDIAGGALAFERIAEGRLEYIVIPADGGPERKVAEFGPAPEGGNNRIPGVSWTSDGRSLVVTQTPQPAAPGAAGPATRQSAEKQAT